MEIKKGDIVRVSKDAPELYTMYGQTDWESIESTVEKIDGDAAEIKHLNELSDEFDFIAIPIKYLVKVDAEAKEAKFKYQVGQKVILHFYGGEVSTITEAFRDGGVWNKYKVKMLPNHVWNENELDPYIEPAEQTEAEETKTKGDTLTFPIAFDLSDGYWDAYTADLAKEVALKITNKHMDEKPEDVGAYAVSVAKAVVKNLKKK